MLCLCTSCWETSQLVPDGWVKGLWVGKRHENEVLLTATSLRQVPSVEGFKESTYGINTCPPPAAPAECGLSSGQDGGQSQRPELLRSGANRTRARHCRACTVGHTDTNSPVAGLHSCSARPARAAHPVNYHLWPTEANAKRQEHRAGAGRGWRERQRRGVPLTFVRNGGA